MNTTQERPLFVLIDDDPINNSITRLTITNAVPSVEVLVFTSPNEGLGFFMNEFALYPVESAILLLNLNMPFMSGWEFLDHFIDLDGEIKERVQIYILTSSLDLLDRKRAEEIDIVKGYLTKPLSAETASNI